MTLSREMQRFVISVLVILTNAIIVLTLIFRKELDVTVESVQFMAIGSALTWTPAVLNWYLGSSSGSDQKTALIKNMMERSTR